MKIVRVLGGVLAADLVGALVCGLYALLWSNEANPPYPEGLRTVLSYTIYPNLLLVPMAMGVVAAAFWNNLNLGRGSYFAFSLCIWCVAVVGATFVLKEGTVCLIIASPILFFGTWAGSEIGRSLFRRGGKSQLGVVPILFLAVLAEHSHRNDRDTAVTDRLVIRAPASEVWKHVIAFPKIEAAPNYWLSNWGLPSPSSTTCEGEFVGADRRCIFSNGVELKERVAKIVPQKSLTFDIVEQPVDPELLGHLTLRRGQFSLEENRDGTTTLVGRSWYCLHVRPRWYFDWWTRDITRHVHLRVMEHIRGLSESRR
jgi:hypothetical protein